jgi:predicted MFS family arabinose efflux permease
VSAEGVQKSAETAVVTAALVVGTLGVATLLVLPALLGVVRRDYGFEEAQLGSFSFADLGGVTVGSAIGAKLLPKIGIRQGTRMGLVVAAAANIASATIAAYWPLLTLRVIAGTGAGVCVAVCFVELGRSKQVDRNFSLYLISQGIFGAAGLKAIPWLSTLVGAAGVFSSLAALYTAALLFTPCLRSHTHGSSEEARVTPAGFAAWMGLGAFLAYFVGQGAIWAFVGVIGVRGGVDLQAAATGLAVAMLAGLCGAGMAAVLGSRSGRLGPLMLGLLMALTSLTLLSLPLDAVRFAVATCLFQVAWNFTIPYQLAVIAGADPTGRMVGWTAFASLAGSAIGPAIAAVALDAAGVVGVLWLGAAFCILSFCALIPAWTVNAAVHASEGNH